MHSAAVRLVSAATHQQIFFSTSCQRAASSWIDGVSYTALRIRGCAWGDIGKGTGSD